MIKELEILRKKGYFVRVDIFGSRVVVHYPAHTILDKKSPSFSKEYSLVDGGVVLDGEFIAIPFYLRRLAILSDIFSQCHYAEISTSLVFYFDGEKEFPSFWEALKLDLSPEDAQKEGVIIKLLSGEQVPVEEQVKVFKSYKMMRGIMYG